MGSTREERRKMSRRTIREAIAVLSGDNALERLDCTVLGLNSFSQGVQRCLIEAVGGSQDKYLLMIAAAAVALLEEALEELERDE